MLKLLILLVVIWMAFVQMLTVNKITATNCILAAGSDKVEIRQCQWNEYVANFKLLKILGLDKQPNNEPRIFLPFSTSSQNIEDRRHE